MKNLVAVLVLLFSTTILCAQQDEAAAPVRVARLSYFSGAVRVERADNTGDPSGQPVLNMPIGEGTRIALGDYSQAELEFEDGSVVRLTPRSTLLVESLTLEGGVARTRLTVLSGLVYLELRKSPGFSYAVTAGGVVMSPVENAVGGRTLQQEQRYDRLALDREMMSLTAAVKDRRARGLENIVPVLRSLAEDVSLLERVRMRARGLLESVETGK